MHDITSLLSARRMALWRIEQMFATLITPVQHRLAAGVPA
jgi:hypothetical protein